MLLALYYPLLKLQKFLLAVAGVPGSGKTELLEDLKRRVRSDTLHIFPRIADSELEMSIITRANTRSPGSSAMYLMLHLHNQMSAVKKMRDAANFEVGVIKRSPIDGLVDAWLMHEDGALNDDEHHLMCLSVATWTTKCDFILILEEDLAQCMKNNVAKQATLDSHKLESYIVRYRRAILGTYRHYLETTDNVPGLYVFKVSGLSRDEKFTNLFNFINWLKRDRSGFRGFESSIVPFLEHLKVLVQTTD